MNADRINVNTGIRNILDWDPDVVVLYGYQDITNLLVAVLCRMSKTPYILTGEISYVWGSTLAGKLKTPFVGVVVRGAKCLAPASKSCAQYFQSLGGNPSCLRTIPPIPDVHNLEAISDGLRSKAASIRLKYNLEGKFVVLYVGRLHDFKGVFEMFKALDIVAKVDPRVYLVIVGTGPLEHEVKELCASRSGNCLYLGSIGDDALLEMFAVSDIHLLPSWYEAYGVITAESLACGVPSIVTRTSGCSDLIIDGVNGFLIEPRDPKSISDAILKVISDPGLLQSMRQSARVSLKNLSMDDLHNSLKDLIRLAVSSAR